MPALSSFSSFAEPLARTSEGSKSGPIGLAIILILCIACYFLFKSMSRHLKHVREDFPGGRPAQGASAPGASAQGPSVPGSSAAAQVVPPAAAPVTPPAAQPPSTAARTADTDPPPTP